MPVSLGLGAASLLWGIGQKVFSGKKKKERALEQFNEHNAPTYNPDKGIQDYYKEAQNRYNVNPYQSRMYQYAQQQTDKNQAAGLNNLQGRRSALGGVSNIVNASNDAMLKAGVNAEQENNQRFGVLGNAAQLNAAENQKAFQINQQQPFERKYNLLAMKAAQAAQQSSAGNQNIGNGLGYAAMGAGNVFANNNNIDMSGGSGGNGFGLPTQYSDYLKYKKLYGNR